MSPYLASQIRARAPGGELFGEPADEIVAGKPKKRDYALRVTVWECPKCAERYDYEEEAEDCCQGKPPGSVSHHEEGQANACPACGLAAPDPQHAADCCLWHDFDAPARWRIAARVEAGADWVDAIALETEVTA